jgi:hypothetical protein
MNVSCQIMFPAGESPPADMPNSMDLAAAILVAVGGDPAKDICHVQINDVGNAGLPPAAPAVLAPAAAVFADSRDQPKE